MNLTPLVAIGRNTLGMLGILSVIACSGEYDDENTAEPAVPSTNTVVEPTVETTVADIGGTYVVSGLASVLSFDTAIQNFSVDTADRSGKTLYVFNNDPIGVSTCTSENCLDNWPPLIVTDDSAPQAPLSTIVRNDGYTQLTLRGKPLYFYSGDIASGDINGEGVGGVWHVAKSEPVTLSTDSLSPTETGYLVASGNVLVSTPEVEGSTSTFIAQKADMAGMSLYTFDADSDNESSCNGACLVNWPALLAEDGDIAEAPFSIINRQMSDTGNTARQWAYHGKPLYFYSQDLFPGSTQGKGVANWTLLRPGVIMDLAGTLSASGLVRVADANGVSSQAKHRYSLYTFDDDSIGSSLCNGACLDNWPALIAHEGAVATAPYSLIQRSSGDMQWAYNGLPLYFYGQDSEPGDTNGDGVGGVWHLARTSLVTQKTTAIGATYTVSSAASVLTSDSGVVLQNRRGMSLYMFDNDPVGASTCNSEVCITTWPPLIAADEDNAQPPLSIVVRDDGNRQWALRGKPLYFYTGDSEVDDINGEGVGGLWHVAQSEPLVLADDTIVTDAGDFLVASGNVLISAPEVDGNTSSFVIYRQNREGQSLYTFDSDPVGQSNCFGQCLANWPALLAEVDDVAEAPFSIIDRQMNTNGGFARQWAYHGKPLYFFSGDVVPGDTLGKDLSGWNLLRPQPHMIARVNEKNVLLGSGLVYTTRSRSDGSIDVTLEARHGYTLYTSDSDSQGVSNCLGSCLVAWPALMAHDGAVAEAPYSLITRVEGLQWALDGKPLYFYHVDSNPGDALGDGVGNAWHIAEVNSEDSSEDDDNDGGGYGY